MKKTIRWGIVGPGIIAKKFAKAVQNVEGAELVGVASRSYEKGKEFAEEFNIPNVFNGYEEMTKSPEIDAVYIATLHPFHKPCAEMFLNAKKHVLCEKPVCVNAKEAKELLECAKKNNVFLMEAMWTRFLPAIHEAVKIAKSGEIGEIKGVSADFCYPSSPEDCSKLFDNELAGGALLDVGVYTLNFAAIFLGTNPESITSVSNVNYGVDCHTTSVLKYENGVLATLTSAIDVSKPSNGYIYGTKGYIRMPFFYMAKELYVADDYHKERNIEKPRIGEGFEEEIIEACNCIREGKTQSDIMPMSESIKILEQMDYIREQIGLKYPADDN